MIKQIIIVIILLIAVGLVGYISGYLNSQHVYKQYDYKLLIEMREKEMIIQKSEYYTKMSQIIWGKEARRCDAGLIIKINNLIKEIDTTLTIDEILSLICIESGFNNYAVSSAGAVGLMQILTSTAKEIDTTITERDLFNEDVNLRLGIQYLSRLKKYFAGNMDLALMAYNRGYNRVLAEIKDGKPQRGYVNKIQKYKSEVR